MSMQCRPIQCAMSSTTASIVLGICLCHTSNQRRTVKTVQGPQVQRKHNKQHNHMQTPFRRRARRESLSEKGTCNTLFHKLQLLQNGGLRGEGAPQTPTLPRLQTQRSMDSSMLLRHNTPVAQTDEPNCQTISHDLSRSAQTLLCWLKT